MRTATLALAVLVAAAAVAASPAGAQTEPPSVERIEGSTRYQTAAAAARGAVDSADTVIAASGEDYADALAGSAMAGTGRAPVVLVPSRLPGGELPAGVADAVDGLGAETVVVLGGTSAIGPDVAAALADETGVAGANVTRLAGASRYETAELAAQTVATIDDDAAETDLDADTLDRLGLADREPGPATVAFLATGLDFPDALAAGPGAYAGSHPVLLTGPDELHAAARRGLAEIAADVVVVLGGTSAVGASVADAVAAEGYDVARVDGATRFHTAAELAGTLRGLAGLDLAEVGVASGAADGGGADALAAAPFLGERGAPLLLTGGDELPEATAAVLAGGDDVTERLHVFGGPGAVDDAVVERLAGGVDPTVDRVDVDVAHASLIGDDAQVGVTVAAADGEPVGGRDVHVEVYRDGQRVTRERLDAADGRATFTFTHDAEADDHVVACVAADDAEANGQGCATWDGDAPALGDDRVGDVAAHRWVPPTVEGLEVRLNWQNVVADVDGSPVLGAVDDVAAATLADNGVGTVELAWNRDAGVVAATGELELSDAGLDDAAALTLAPGGLREVPDADAAIALGAVGGDADGRGPRSVEVDASVADPRAAEHLAALEAALDDGGGLTGGDVVGWSLQVATAANPDGEARGQLRAPDDGLLGGSDASDGGLGELPAVYRRVRATADGVELAFDAPIATVCDPDHFTVRVDDADADVIGCRVGTDTIALEVDGGVGASADATATITAPGREAITTGLGGRATGTDLSGTVATRGVVAP